MPACSFTRAIDAATRWSGLVGLMATDTSTAPLASGGDTRTTRGTGAVLASPLGSWPGFAPTRSIRKDATAAEHRNGDGMVDPPGSRFGVAIAVPRLA